MLCPEIRETKKRKKEVHRLIRKMEKTKHGDLRLAEHAHSTILGCGSYVKLGIRKVHS